MKGVPQLPLAQPVETPYMSTPAASQQSGAAPQQALPLLREPKQFIPMKPPDMKPPDEEQPVATSRQPARATEARRERTIAVSFSWIGVAEEIRGHGPRG